MVTWFLSHGDLKLLPIARFLCRETDGWKKLHQFSQTLRGNEAFLRVRSPALVFSYTIATVNHCFKIRIMVWQQTVGGTGWGEELGRSVSSGFILGLNPYHMQMWILPIIFYGMTKLRANDAFPWQLSWICPLSPRKHLLPTWLFFSLGKSGMGARGCWLQ